MKKRMLILILAALLAVNTGACNSLSEDNIPNEDMPSSDSEDSSESITDTEVQITEGSIPCNGNNNNRIAYEISENGELTLHIDAWDEDHTVAAVSASNTEIEAFRKTLRAIAINDEQACLLLMVQSEITVIRFEKGSPDEAVTSLEVSQDVIEIAGNFTNENVGYLFAFKEVSDGHARGGAKLTGFYKTEDGGSTWNLIDVQNVPSISLQEYIVFAKMITEDVGLISGNYFANDYNFCKRTLLTTDGGLNWVHVADLPQINELLWATATDFTQVDDAYVLTVRYKSSDVNGEYGYAEYKLTELNTWVRIS